MEMSHHWCESTPHCTQVPTPHYSYKRGSEQQLQQWQREKMQQRRKGNGMHEQEARSKQAWKEE
jgi:hypothetical protein